MAADARELKGGGGEGEGRGREGEEGAGVEGMKGVDKWSGRERREETDGQNAIFA